MSDGVWPEMFVDGCRPSALGVQQHAASCILEVSDSLLRPPVLVVCPHAAERDGLLGVLPFEMFQKGCFIEASVVRVVMLYFYTVLPCKSLKRLFCFNCFFGACRSLQVNKCQVGEVVNENSSAEVALVGKPSFDLPYEPPRG